MTNDNKLNNNKINKFITPVKNSPSKIGLFFPINTDFSFNKNFKSPNNSSPNPMNSFSNNITPFKSTPQKINLINSHKTYIQDLNFENNIRKLNFEDVTPTKNINHYYKNNNLKYNVSNFNSPSNNLSHNYMDYIFSKTNDKRENNFHESFNAFNNNIKISTIFDDMEENHAKESPKTNKKKACKCSKSKCLKLYCECFINEELCGPECKCLNCFNTIENIDLIQKIKLEISTFNPSSFESKYGQLNQTKIHKRGCNCKKSSCKKNYCECFINNVPCTDICKCVDCKNMYIKDQNKEEIDEIIKHNNERKRAKLQIENIINANIIEKFGMK